MPFQRLSFDKFDYTCWIISMMGDFWEISKKPSVWMQWTWFVFVGQQWVVVWKSCKRWKGFLYGHDMIWVLVWNPYMILLFCFKASHLILINLFIFSTFLKDKG